MKSKLALWVASFAAWAVAQPASATTVFTEKFTCPIGEEKFSANVIGSTSSWGQKPDGMPIGGVAPWPVVECPSNGLPLYKDDFTSEELAALEPLVASEEFARMRVQDTSYRRIWWLRGRLGGDHYSLVGNLLAASWQTDDNATRKARYQRDFAAAAEALVRTDEHAANWFWYSLRAANAYRELGRLDDAARLLAKIDHPDLLPSDAEERAAARELIDGLSPLIAESNRASEPVNLVGPTNAVFRCRESPADMTATETAACASAPFREAIDEMESYEADSAANAEANVEAATEAVEEATMVIEGEEPAEEFCDDRVEKEVCAEVSMGDVEPEATQNS